MSRLRMGPVLPLLVLGLTSLGSSWADSLPTPQEHYVSPTGSPAGDGSTSQPWDLQTALSHPPQLRPGDTLWLRGGTYADVPYYSTLAGSPGLPITVRSHPGEWAKIENRSLVKTDTITIDGSWANFWGFEVTQEASNRMNSTRGSGGPTVFGNNIKLINLIVHDNHGNGISFWSSAVDSEVSGCVIYNNGWDEADRGHGHGLYTQNTTGTKRIADNILCNGFSFGVHAYTQGGFLIGFDFVGNAWFQNGVASQVSDHKDDCLIGGYTPADRILLEENCGWAPSLDERCVRLGWSAPLDGSVTLRNNTTIGATVFNTPWSSVAMADNVMGAVVGADPGQSPGNVFLTAKPAANRILVRPNPYEPGRAHIIVYNFERLDSVTVDLRDILSSGSAFQIRNAQDFVGNPVLEGSYSGPIQLPMNLEPAQPLGAPGAIPDGEKTGKEFQVFVLLAHGSAPPPPPPGGGGGAPGGGSRCGLLGIEGILLWGILTMARRRAARRRE